MGTEVGRKEVQAGRQQGKRAIHRLTARGAATASKPGDHCDGGGLYLQVSRSGARSWLFKYSRGGRAREMGLGAAHTVSLAEARETALQCRKQLLAGIDPLDARRDARLEQATAAARVMSFDQCAEAYIEAHRAGWRNPKHAAQWEATLATYASPIFGKLPVATIDTALVMRVLDPIWRDRTETATRLRGRIESVLAWATVRGMRQGDNPAAWRNHLDQLLPAPSKVAKREHHRALPHGEVGGFMQKLREQEGVAARALEFAVLTVARTNEVIGARWGEFNMEGRVWVVPAERMKAGRPHRVPLSEQAMTVLRRMAGKDIKPDQFVFPGRRPEAALSNMSMLALVQRRMRLAVTTHGFRACFRTWCGEATNYPRELAEMSLAHVIASKVEAAYARGDLLERRRELMQAWARYCDTQPGAAAVIPIRRGAKAKA